MDFKSVMGDSSLPHLVSFSASSACEVLIKPLSEYFIVYKVEQCSLYHRDMLARGAREVGSTQHNAREERCPVVSRRLSWLHLGHLNPWDKVGL